MASALAFALSTRVYAFPNDGGHDDGGKDNNPARIDDHGNGGGQATLGKTGQGDDHGIDNTGDDRAHDGNDKQLARKGTSRSA